VGNECLGIVPGGIWRIDAARHFKAAVDAVLFVCRMEPRAARNSSSWPVYASLDAKAPSGLYKRLRFCVVGPHDEQPVMVDDTCYFLPFSNETDAQKAARALESEMALDYFRGRVFWDAKRPISKAILQNLDVERLIDLK
jgi:hypothetical protein